MDTIYTTERIQTEQLKIIDGYWYEGDTPWLGDFDLWPQGLFQYYDEMPLGEDIESSYTMCKSERHILTPKYDILCSLVLPV